LVLFIGFSTTMVANAELRKAVSNWFITHFSDHSSFQSADTSNNVADINFDDIVIGYVPDGFELEKRDTDKNSFSCTYLNDHNHILYILLTDTKSPVSINTENAEIIKKPYKNTTALYWTQSDITYLLWEDQGLLCHISCNSISSDEIFKIADEIKIK